MAECEKIMQLCEESLDRTLSGEEQEQLEQHLQSCESCAAYLADLQFMTAALGEEPEFPAGLHASILSGIEAEVRSTVIQTHRPGRKLPVFAMLAAAAACVMLVLSGALGDLLNTFDFRIGGGGSSGSEAAAGAAPAEAEFAGTASAEDEVSADAAPADGSRNSEGAADGGESPADNGSTESVAAPYAVAAEEPKDNSAPIEGRSAKMNYMPSMNGASGAGENALSDQAAAQSLDNGEPMLRSVPDAAGEGTVDSAAESQPQVGAFITNIMEGEVFAACYLVEGGENLPEIGRELQRDGHFAYYVANNNLSQLETLLDSLEKAGCTVRSYEESGVLFNESAHRVIIVVRLD